MRVASLLAQAIALGRMSQLLEQRRGHIPTSSGPIWMRWARRASRMTQKERQADRAAADYARKLGPKFARMTRQQRFRVAFAGACREAKEKYGPEPRRARRKIARAWARKMVKSSAS